MYHPGSFILCWRDDPVVGAGPLAWSAATGVLHKGRCVCSLLVRFCLGAVDPWASYPGLGDQVGSLCGPLWKAV